MKDKCTWSRAEFSIWNTCQGDAWQFHEEEDTPESNGMKFCPFCGRSIVTNEQIKEATESCPTCETIMVGVCPDCGNEIGRVL